MLIYSPGQRIADAGRAKRLMMGQDSFGLSACTEKDVAINEQLTNLAAKVAGIALY